jgi:hypothetical protein
MSMFDISWPIPRVWARGAILALALATPAGAQQAISTAQDTQLGGAPPPPPPSPVDLPPHRLDIAQNIVRPVGPCGGLPNPDTGKLDKSPHGEVFAGAGTHGYREAGGVVCVPIGDHAAVNVAVDFGRYPSYGWRY